MDKELVFGKVHCPLEQEMIRKNRPKLAEPCLDLIEVEIGQCDLPNPHRIGDHVFRPTRPVCSIHFSTLPQRLREIEENYSEELELLAEPSNPGLNDHSRL